VRSYASMKFLPEVIQRVNLLFRDFHVSAEWFSPKNINERFRWMNDLTAGDYIKIVRTEDYDLMADYIPDFTKKLRDHLKKNKLPKEPDISKHVEAIREALKAYNAKFKRAAITLMFSENEGLVWDLAEHIAVMHNIFFDRN